MINIAFVGFGEHAVRAHYDHLIGMPDQCAIIGGYDKNPNALLDKGIKSYARYDGLLADPAIDAVLISSPDRFHLPQMVAAIRAGKHVFCEKPLCITQHQLDVLAQTFAEAQSRGLSISSCHPRRFDPPYVWLKRELPNFRNLFGKPLSVSLDFSYHESDPAKAHLHGGSLLQDHANHEIDYVNWLFGLSDMEVTKLIDRNDRYEMTGMRHKDDVTFHFSGSRLLHNSIYPEVVRIRLARGEVTVNTYDPSESFVISHDAIRLGKIAPGVHNAIDPGTTDYNERFRALNQSWLSHLEGGPNYLSPQEMTINTRLSVSLQKRNRLSVTL